MQSYEDRKRQAKSRLFSIMRQTGKETIDNIQSTLSFGGNRLLETDNDCDSEAASDDFNYEDMIDEFLMNTGATLVKGIAGAAQVGFSHLMYLFRTHPLPFDTFLNYTGMYFDQLILETCNQENIRYVGGKLLLETVTEEEIRLSAHLYYYTQNETWTVQECDGSVSPERFTDWESNPDLVALQNNGSLEYPIDPPEALERE